MDSQSLCTRGSSVRSRPGKPRKKVLSKRARKYQEKLRSYRDAKARGDPSAWQILPFNKHNSITLHLVHRPDDDPLLTVPSENGKCGDWVLEPEVRSRRDFERVQRLFYD